MTVPVFFRLLYSSGMRTTEVRLLHRKDIDLQSGIIKIKQTKGHMEHYVVLHDTMLELMKIYDKAIEKLQPNRTYFLNATNQSVTINKIGYPMFSERFGKMSVSPKQLLMISVIIMPL